MPMLGALKTRSEPKVHVHPLKTDGPLLSGASRGEVPFLVEFAVVRQIGFGHHPAQLSAVQHHGAVEEGM
jgi:hypothetical protein